MTKLAVTKGICDETCLQISLGMMSFDRICRGHLMNRPAHRQHHRAAITKIDGLICNYIIDTN
jgi:hypothetical protein